MPTHRLVTSPNDPGGERTRQPRAHEHVLAAVEEQILREQLRTGDRLPSERDLAKILGVSRPSVREALRVLEWMGVLSAAVGSGKESGSIITAHSNGALTRLFRIHLALANFSLYDLVETRGVMEAAAAEAAAKHATADDVERLTGLIARMRGTNLEPSEFNELDTEFHVAIARASGNNVLSELMQALRDAMRQEMVRAFDRLGPGWRKATAKLIREHSGVLAAIQAHDGPAAAQKVRRHIASFYRTSL